MKASSITSILLLLSPIVSSLEAPRDELVALDDNSPPEAIPEVSNLEKRRGGGGGGRHGSSSSSSSGSAKGSNPGSEGGSSSSGTSQGSRPGTSRNSGSSSGSSKSNSGSSGSSSDSSGSSGSSKGGGSSSGGSSSKSSSSNAGGTTKSGSGTTRSYGGGTYYAGGATTPYTAGGRTSSGILPYLLLGTGLGFASAAAWHDYSAYAYPYNMPYYYHQPMATNHNNGPDGNYTMNVVCYCDQYSECGCDNNNNSTYLAEVIGDPPRNSSVVTITQNGTNETAYINGTLANGTTAADPNASGASSVLAMGSAWPVVALVSAMMYAV